MEDQRVTKKHGKNKSQISISTGNGGAIAGILLLGGALAVTGFMAVASFATCRKNKERYAHHKPKSLLRVPQELDDAGCKTEDEATPGLCSVFHDSKSADGCKTCGSGTLNKSMNEISSSELLSRQTSILEEEKLDLGTNTEKECPTCFHQEILFSDDSDNSPPGSAESSNENGVGEECPASLLYKPCFKSPEADTSEPEEGLKSIEMIEADEDTTPETEDDVDEDEDEDDDDVESNDVSESGEDSSEATGRTSLDSHEDAIWPAELMEEPKQQLKGEIVDSQSQLEGTYTTKRSADYYDSEVSSDSDEDSSDHAGNNEAMAPEATLNEKANLYVVLNDRPLVSHSSKWGTWIISVLLLAVPLLLVMLTHRTQESYDVLYGGNAIID